MSRQVNYKMAEKEIFNTSPGESWPIGTRGYAPGGRVFRMVRANAVALTVGKLVRKPENEVKHADLTVAAAVDVGANEITLTLTGRTTIFDEYKDGLIYINDEGGQGHAYEVVGNTATLMNNTLTIDINAGLKVALTTSSKATLIKNRYNGVRITEPSPFERVLGVAPVAVTASYYFWLQTGGPAVVLQDGPLYETRDVIPSTRIRGAVAAAGSVTVAEVLVADALGNERLVEVAAVPGAVPSNTFGYALDPRVDTDYALIQMELD